MELTPMIIFRPLSSLALAGALSLTAGVAMAQHDVGGGSTKDAAVGGEPSSRGKTVKRPRTTPSTVRKPPPVRAPVRRGITAEQYNQQGDAQFEAKQYDDALELYLKAVQLRPLALAFYHIGWIYNDKEDYDQAIPALQQSIRLNPSDAEVLSELGYSYRTLKRFDEALDSYRRAISPKRDHASPHYPTGRIYQYLG